MTAMTQTYFMTGRHVRALLRQPWYIAASLSQPVIWLILFGALFSGVTAIPGFGGGSSYIDYLVPAILVMTALFSCGWSGMGIIEDLDRGIMDRFLVSPVHRSAIITGRTLYEMVALLVQALIIGGLALLLGSALRRWAAGLRRPRRLRDARRRRLQLVLGRDGPAHPPARVGHRGEHDARPAPDLPLRSVHAPRPGARLDRDGGPRSIR